MSSQFEQIKNELEATTSEKKSLEERIDISQKDLVTKQS